MQGCCIASMKQVKMSDQGSYTCRNNKRQVIFFPLTLAMVDRVTWYLCWQELAKHPMENQSYQITMQKFWSLKYVIVSCSYLLSPSPNYYRHKKPFASMELNIGIGQFVEFFQTSTKIYCLLPSCNHTGCMIYFTCESSQLIYSCTGASSQDYN